MLSNTGKEMWHTLDMAVQNRISNGFEKFEEFLMMEQLALQSSLFLSFFPIKFFAIDTPW